MSTTLERALQYVAVSSLGPFPLNPRKNPDPTDILDSVRAHGIIQPLTVRPSLTGGYEVVAGSRRHAAAVVCELVEVPCIIAELSDSEAFEISVIENLAREDIHPMDEVEAFDSALKSGIYEDARALADKIGKPVEFVTRRMSLMNLTDEAKVEFRDGNMGLNHAELLARLPASIQAEAVTAMFYSTRWDGKKQARDERRQVKTSTSAKGLADWLDKNVYLQLSAAPFDLGDANLVKKCGACPVCPKRTGAAKLFDDAELERDDSCLDSKCFHAKTDAHFEALAKA